MTGIQSEIEILALDISELLDLKGFLKKEEILDDPETMFLSDAIAVVSFGGDIVIIDEIEGGDEIAGEDDVSGEDDVAGEDDIIDGDVIVDDDGNEYETEDKNVVNAGDDNAFL